VHPIIFELGPFALHSYGLSMAVAFGLGIWLADKRAAARGLGHKFAVDLSVLILIFSLLGARATYVFTHLTEFAAHPWDAISPLQHNGKIGIAGLVLLGGVIAGFATAFYFARKRRVSFLTVTDIFVPSLALGIAIGRIGCFFNGCCFGVPTDLPWGIHFPAGSMADDVFGASCVHPTQAYESLYMLVVLGALLFLDRTHLALGKLTGWFLLLYGCGRFLIEQIRWYEASMILWQNGALRFTFSQAISLGMIGVGAWLLLRRVRLAPDLTRASRNHP
jgi:phosphatidylglycerol:prolipoprotein diacylglycerol transferase